MNRLWVALVVLAACKGDAKPRVHDAVVARDAASAPERWGGGVVIPDQPVLELEVVFAPGPPARATISIPAQQVREAELADVTFTDTTITFTIAASGAVFRLDRDAATAQGTLEQGGATMLVRMRRLADHEHVGDGSRPQDPRPPLPYDEREARYASKDGTTLAGTLTVPRDGGPHAAVVLVTGSGVQNRDAEMLGHRPFRVLADHLTRAGIAVLRVDDRGIGGSGGDTLAASIDDKADDVLAGLAWLATQPDVDAARLGVIGHSEGGAIAPLAAVRTTATAVAFVVLLAAPGINGAALSMIQVELQLRAAGVPEPIIAAQLAGQRRCVDLQVAGGTAAELGACVGEHVVDAVAKLVPESERASYQGAGRDQKVAASVTMLDSKAQRSFSAIDPTIALAQLRVPVLALCGSLDLQVPAGLNLAKIRGALADHPDATIAELPGLNHMFQPATTGLPGEYARIDTTFDPAALERITTWVVSKAKR